jgi:hypothetical protein
MKIISTAKTAAEMRDEIVEDLRRRASDALIIHGIKTSAKKKTAVAVATAFRLTATFYEKLEIAQ